MDDGRSFCCCFDFLDRLVVKLRRLTDGFPSAGR